MTTGIDPDLQSRQIATAAVEQWQQITAALAPIIGLRGVAALFRRSLSISSSAFPALSGLCALAQTDHPYRALQAALANQEPALAASASSALISNFQHLLTSLIGAALTERLLRDVWPPPSSNSGDAVEDSTS